MLATAPCTADRERSLAGESRHAGIGQQGRRAPRQVAVGGALLQDPLAGQPKRSARAGSRSTAQPAKPSREVGSATRSTLAPGIARAAPSSSPRSAPCAGRRRRRRPCTRRRPKASPRARRRCGAPPDARAGRLDRARPADQARPAPARRLGPLERLGRPRLTKSLHGRKNSLLKLGGCASRPRDERERPLSARGRPTAPDPAAAANEPTASARGRGAAQADLEARHAELSDAYLRAKAEAENTRRRAEEEMAKARKFAVESFAESLLPVKRQPRGGDRHPGGDARAAARRRPRDPAPADAPRSSATRSSRSTRRPARSSTRTSTRRSASCRPTQEPNTVVAVLQKGYMIADRVLRPALVTVSARRRAGA